MEICILNYGMNPGEPGPCLKGNIELVSDVSPADYDSEDRNGPSTTLKMILLNELTHADINRLVKKNHTIKVKICCNIFNEKITPRSAVAKFDSLTHQELIILSHLADGKKYKDIAPVLNISLETVKSHAYSAYRKIGLHSKILVGFAFILFRVLKLLQ